MGKHPIGGMRSMMIANRNADMRHRKKAFLRNKELADVGQQKKGKVKVLCEQCLSASTRSGARR